MACIRRLAAPLLMATLGLSACGGGDSKGTAPGGGAAASTSKAGGPAPTVLTVPDDLARLVPADAVGVLYTPSLEALEGKIRSLVAGIDADAAREVDFGKMLEEIAGPAAGEVDRTRPVAVGLSVGADEKSPPRPTFVFPVRDGAAAKAAFGDIPPGRPGPVILGKYLALSQSPTFAPEAKPSALLHGLPQGDLTVRVDLARLIAAYRSGIDKSMGKLGEAVPGGEGPRAQPGLEGAQEMMKGLADFAKKLLDSAERLDLTLRLEGGSAALDFAFTAKAGSALDRPQGARGDVASIAACLPKDFPIVALLGFGLQQMADWMPSMTGAFMGTLPEKARDSVQRLLTQSKDMYALLGDEMALGMSLGASGIEGVEVVSAKDAKAYLAKLEGMFKGESASALAEMGIAYEALPSTTVAGAPVLGWAMKFDWEKLTAASGRGATLDPKAREAMRKSMGAVFGPDGLKVRTAAVGQRVVVVFGGGDELMAQAIASAKAPGAPPPGVAAALARAGDRPAIVVALDLRQVIAGILELVGKAMPEESARKVPSLPAGGPVPVAFHATGSGREYWGGLEVDVQGAARLIKALVEQSKKQPIREPVSVPGEK